MAVKPIPDDYPRISPYLSIEGAKEAIEFYCNALGASKRGDAMTMPDGTVGHAELDFGDAVVMLADASEEWGNPSPKKLGGTPVGISLYVEDVDAVYAKAVELGATSDREPTDEFWGDRAATITDPWGHKWHLMTHTEDVSPEEMEKRMAQMGG